MLWRTLKSSYRPGGQLQLRNPEAWLLQSRIHALRARQLHHSNETSSDESPSTVSHARLLDNAEDFDPGRGNERVKIAGLVRSVRRQKKIAFARVGDGSTLANVQAVFPDPTLAKEYAGLNSKNIILL